MVDVKSCRLPASVLSKVRNCAEPPQHLRSEISFLRTCNIQNLISYIHRLALSKRFTGRVSTVYISGSQTFSSRYPNQGIDYVLLPSIKNFRISGRKFLLQ